MIKDRVASPTQRHAPMGTQPTAFTSHVVKPLEARQEEGLERAKTMLREVMVRGSKKSVHLLNQTSLERKERLLPFTKQHASSYNQLVEQASGIRSSDALMC